ncbi:MAG: 8-amino-7-oxononanoate synthase, partial [Proteobacteria bacterium]
GREVIAFASNDYLGLARHPRVREAAHAALERWGGGATASRLIVGTRPVHLELEARIAQWKRTERALVFPNGFSANLAALAVFGGPDVTIFSDALNHASIIDGCRLSRAQVRIYPHADVCGLEALLARTPGRKLVVTDTVFSMDGDVAPLEDLARLCVQHDALLVLDEAHAVLGPHWQFPAELALLRVGTLSKTLGALGGWIAGAQPFIELLINRGRSFIFTTGLSPADAAAALAALDVYCSDEGAALRARLRAHVERLRPGHPSPIVPLILGEDAAALDAARRLRERGLWIPAIRPPTVPPGTARLRIALSAAHTDAMIDRLLAALDELQLALPTERR